MNKRLLCNRINNRLLSFNRNNNLIMYNKDDGSGRQSFFFERLSYDKMYINLMNRYIRAKYNVQNPESIFNGENNFINEVNRTAS